MLDGSESCFSLCFGSKSVTTCGKDLERARQTNHVAAYHKTQRQKAHVRRDSYDRTERFGRERKKKSIRHEIARGQTDSLRTGSVRKVATREHDQRPPIHCDVLSGAEKHNDTEPNSQRGDVVVNKPLLKILADVPKYGGDRELQGNDPRLSAAAFEKIEGVDEGRPQQLDAVRPHCKLEHARCGV